MSQPAPDFDRVSGIYRWAEYLALGKLLERTREHYIPQLSGRRHALALGDGDGRFLAKLLRANGTVRILAVDTSERMLALLTARCRKATPNADDRLATHWGSALEVTPSPDTDLITTHFFLDCLMQDEVKALALQIGHKVAPGTLWIVSEFGMPHQRILRPLAKLYIRSLYLAFGVLTGLRVSSLPDPQSALSAAGFERLNRHESVGGLLYAELWRRR